MEAKYKSIQQSKVLKNSKIPARNFSNCLNYLKNLDYLSSNIADRNFSCFRYLQYSGCRSGSQTHE